MVDSLEFINNQVFIYCGHDIYKYNINDLYIIRYVSHNNNEYILYVKDTEDKFIIPNGLLLDVFTKIGVKIL